MPSIINSDDGVVSGSAGLKTSGANDGITVFQQNGTESMRIGSNGAVTLSVTLPVASGGTGAATLAANNVLLGNGTSAVQVVAPGTSGNVLTSNGTTWTSGSAPGFPAGTLMLFQQTAAPTGWTKQTTHDNKALRVVSGAAGSGGSVAFTTAFASQSVAGTVGGTTLTTTQMPSHAHQVVSGRQSVGFFNTFTTSGAYLSDVGSATGNAGSATAGSSGSHDHTFTGTAINLAVSYVDLIIASKN